MRTTPKANAKTNNMFPSLQRLTDRLVYESIPDILAPSTYDSDFRVFSPTFKSRPSRPAVVSTTGPTSVSMTSETRDSKRLSAKDFQKFSGTEDVDSWISEVSMVKNIATAEDDDFLRVVPLLMRGAASKWLSTLSQWETDNLDSWEGWQNALRAEYRKANFITTKTKELRNRMWYRNEDFASYYVDRRRLQKQVLGASTPDCDLIERVDG